MHSYPFLTKIWISQSVLHQFTWSLAHFEGIIRGYKRLVQKDWCLWFLSVKDQDCRPVFFSSPVQSSCGLFPVLRLDFQTLVMSQAEGILLQLSSVQGGCVTSKSKKKWSMSPKFVRSKLLVGVKSNQNHPPHRTSTLVSNPSLSTWIQCHAPFVAAKSHLMSAIG